MAPIKIQKLLLFVLSNTTKVYVLNIGRVITGSLEGFAKVRKRYDVSLYANE